MIWYLVLPALDLTMLINTRDRDQASFLAYPVPERSFVFEYLFTAGVDHRFAHGLYLFRRVHIFCDDAPFEIFPVIPVILPDDDRIAVVPQRQEMYAHVQVAIDL